MIVAVLEVMDRERKKRIVYVSDCAFLARKTLLAEGKVLFLSNYAGMLSLACESFRYLLFPFYWQFVYIPVLPEKLLTCLQVM